VAKACQSWAWIEDGEITKPRRVGFQSGRRLPHSKSWRRFAAPPEIQEALNISLWPVRQAGILPAFSAHSQRLKIRESVLECAGPLAFCDRALLHIWDLYDTALCLRVLWVLHHRHVQFFLAFAEGDVCCAITRGDLKYV
jgi:hypothetical protein